MKKYIIDWSYQRDYFTRKRHRIYDVILKSPLNTKTIASFRYKRDAEMFLKNKLEKGKL